MGAAGMEFGLDVSLGDEGFTLKEKLQDEEIDHSIIRTKANNVTLSITNAAPASREFRRLEALLIDKKKVTTPKRGYLTAWRLLPGQPVGPIDADEDAVFLARSLEAVAELAETGRLGTDPRRDGDRTLFFDLGEEGGKQSIQATYRAVAKVDVQHANVVLPAELRERLSDRPRFESTFLLSIFTPPGSIQGKPYWMCMMLDETGRMLVAEVATDFGGAALAFFEALAGSPTVKSDAPGLPDVVVTDSVATMDAITDAASELGLRVMAMEDVPELRRAKESLGEFMRREP
jgi:hypothetical protein